MAAQMGAWLFNPDPSQKKYTYVPPEGLEAGRKHNLTLEQIRDMWAGLDAKPPGDPPQPGYPPPTPQRAELAKSSASEQAGKQSAANDTDALNQSEGTSKKSKGTSAVNKWYTPDVIHEYMKHAEPGAFVYEPQNSMQYETIEDFVSTIRAAASHENSKFRWPEKMLSFEHAVSISLHHLPPGYMISIRNGKACPDNLLNSNEGNLSEYWHGTTCYALARGIIRDGLKPTLGAGGSQAEEAWGVQIPMVYLSRIQDTAAYYPMHNGLMYNTGTGKETRSGGEIISRDGTPPLRAMVRVQAIDSYQLWHRKVKNNDQRAFRPQDLYISHIMFYALPPIMSAPAQLHYVWHLYAEDGRPIKATHLKATKDDDPNERPYEEAYALLTISEEPTPLDITKKTLLATRLAHRPTLIVKRYINMLESPKSLPVALRKIHHQIQQEIPILENTKLNLEDRVAAPTTGATITSVVTGGAHEGGAKPARARAKARTTKGSHSASTGYNQAWWEQESYQGQRWVHPDAGQSATSGSWGKSSTASGWNSWDNQSSWSHQATWDNQSTWSGKWTVEDCNMVRNAWVTTQSKSYTKMYALAINLMVQPLPFDYYEIDKGNYPPVKPGHRCQTTDVYVIPNGEYMSKDSKSEVGNLPTDGKAATPAVELKPRVHLVSNQQTKDIREKDKAWDNWEATQERKRHDQWKQAAHDYRQTQQYYSWASRWVELDAEESNEDPKTKGIPPPKELTTVSFEKTIKRVEAWTQAKERAFAGASPSKRTIAAMPGSESWPEEMLQSGGRAVIYPQKALTVNELEEQYGKGYKLLNLSTKESDAAIKRPPLYQYMNWSNFVPQFKKNSRAYNQHYEKGIPVANQAEDSGAASSSMKVNFNKGEVLESEGDKVTVFHKGAEMSPSPSSDPDAEKEEERRFVSPSCDESSDAEDQTANPAAASKEQAPEAGYAVDEPSGPSMPNSFSSELWKAVEDLKKKHAEPDDFVKEMLQKAATSHDQQSAASSGNQPSSSTACEEIKEEKPEEIETDAALIVEDPAPDQIMTESQDAADQAMLSDEVSQQAQDIPTDPEQSAQSAPMETEQSAQEDPEQPAQEDPAQSAQEDPEQSAQSALAETEQSAQAQEDAIMADDSVNSEQLGQSVGEPGNAQEDPDWETVESADVPIIP